MNRHVVFIILLALFVGTPAQAELKLFPMWEKMQCPTETFACYDFETTKKILKIDLDLQLKLDTLESVSKSLADMKAAYEKIQAAKKLLEDTNASQEIRLKEKQGVLEENTLALVKSEGRSVWNNLHWITIVVVVVAGGAFAGGYYLGSR
jgi:hypothetical protein